MHTANPWLLPEGISEALPTEAARLELLRRRLLDLYQTWGYALVMPPFVEYLSSLLTGVGADLDQQTFKLTDPSNGRLIGIRADMTPQVARIDAHQLKRHEPVRLCYMGTVLHTHPSGFARSRTPLQVGAELYGHAGLDSDAEILSLMLATLRLTGIEDFHIDLGHVEIYRSLVSQTPLDSEQEASLFNAMQRKAVADIHAMLNDWNIEPRLRTMLTRLVELNGGPEVLNEAREVLAGAGKFALQALDELSALQQRLPHEDLYFDLAELRGFSYHTGVMFAAYVAGHGEAVAQGGRYDRIGEVFGRARPATGFSTDLKTLLTLGQLPDSPPAPHIFAPADPDPALAAAVQALRAEGHTVIRGLPGPYNNARAMGCAQQLTLRSGSWVCVSLDAV